MSEKTRNYEERKSTLLMLKLGASVVSGATLTAASIWAIERLKYEQAAQRFTGEEGMLTYLESEAGDIHDGILWKITAASLSNPNGATREDLRNAVGPKLKGSLLFGEALLSLKRHNVLEVRIDKDARHNLIPTSMFAATLFEHQSLAPKLLQQAGVYNPEFTPSDLLGFIADRGVVDTSPLADVPYANGSL